ncbi:TadE/TadG family type IV pilus assembly protein [Rhizobium sp. C4]|uniref:TadE/TadG family type IV pilus assembly protein n=1 Tax=Rhizobium sp. C4 TaxID=1349800 RepID=UPI001E610187|nr:TadE/TadG family type IV pilus assembly protein [Rhizobium sp. C4]MCD2171848.1 pilus assembly protein [Rhizobium sp. C4]
MQTLFQRFWKRKEGAAATEFALLILPFAYLIFAIINIALTYFVDTSLDAAMNKTTRKVRVGYANSNNWSINEFKADVCANLMVSFGCAKGLVVRAVVVTDMNSVNYASPVQNGTLAVSDSYNVGTAGDYVLVQAFLPWKPVLAFYNFSSARLSDGTYILSASHLFKNEPFK